MKELIKRPATESKGAREYKRGVQAGGARRVCAHEQNKSPGARCWWARRTGRSALGTCRSQFTALAILQASLRALFETLELGTFTCTSSCWPSLSVTIKRVTSFLVMHYRYLARNEARNEACNAAVHAFDLLDMSKVSSWLKGQPPTAEPN